MKQKKKVKNGERKKSGEESESYFTLHPEVKNIIFALLFLVCAALFVLSYVGKGGAIGAYIFSFFDLMLGKGYFFAPLVLILMGFSLLLAERPKVASAVMIGGGLFLLSSLSVIEIVFGEKTGGLVGYAIGGGLLRLFDFWAGLIIACGLLGISVLLVINKPFWKREVLEEVEEDEDEEGEEAPVGDASVLQNLQNVLKSAFEKKEDTLSVSNPLASAAAVSANAAAVSTMDAKDDSPLAVRKVAKKFPYKKPPLELLSGDRGTPSSGDIRANANIIKRTLENFNIDVEMGEVSIGPTVTQYTLRPAEGVKLARITALNNDLSLALAAHPIRIEAPIPGKPLVGIEVPNRSIALVGLRSLIEHESFQEGQPLTTTIGRDVAGMPVFADLSRMPHLLVSGTTGSGKSVSIHTIITSLLYRNPPEMLRFIIVDPKRVELTVYNDIPHLLTPIITDAKKTIQALRWAAKEMDRRYDLLSQNSSRDIISYNAKISKNEDAEIMPYLVIIIDELADLMTTYPREVEASIVRIAQMARAVGIHLIVSTQRPSVEVITGLIKANIPSRMAFQVASQVDSRTILDMAGAEKLLGHGDMLFLAGDTAKPKRIQGAFVSEQEVKKVVDFIREGSETPEYNENIFDTKAEEKSGGFDDGDTEEDPMYDEAREIVVEAGKASASFLQRRLRVGYARAARLLDLMEAKGVVGPGDGAKPRDVLIKTAETNPFYE